VAKALPNETDALLTFTYTSCPTIFGVKKRERADLKCAEFNDWVLEQIRPVPANVPIIVVNRTTGNVFGSNRPDEAGYGTPSAYFDQPVDEATGEFQAVFGNNLVSSACRLAKLRPTYLVRPFPEMPVDVPQIAARKQLLGRGPEIAVSIKDYELRHALVWQAQDRAAQTCGVKVLNPLPLLCSAEKCGGLKNNRPLYYDSHHLSEFGNKELVGMFRNVFK